MDGQVKGATLPQEFDPFTILLSIAILDYSNQCYLFTRVRIIGLTIK